ncbi:MAG: phospholipid scramblase-related protein [Polyangiales bacterium]
MSARYDVDDAYGRTIGELRGAFWRPWTFELHGEGRLMAVIKKRWSGLFTEAFSDADNYSVDFEPDAPDRWKLVALASAVLIDVVHFESSKR